METRTSGVKEAFKEVLLLASPPNQLQPRECQPTGEQIQSDRMVSSIIVRRKLETHPVRIFSVSVYRTEQDKKIPCVSTIALQTPLAHALALRLPSSSRTSQPNASP
jgi:hypothetical protein